MKIEYRHSASKTNTFLDSPAFWIINELFDFESEPNARMVMGLAAEDAADHALSKQIKDQDYKELEKKLVEVFISNLNK